MDKIRGRIILFVLSLYILYSLFLSEYFLKLPSFLKEVVFLPLFLVPFFDQKIFQRKLRITYPLLYYIFIIVIYSIIGIINRAPDIGAIRYYLFPIISYIMVVYFMPTKYLEKLVKFYFCFYLLIIVVGYYQMIVSKDVLLSIIAQGLLGDELKVNRTYLFFNVPTIAGTVLGSFMLLFFLLKKYQKWLIIGLPVFIYCFSRSAIVAIFVSLVSYYIVKYRTNRFFLFAILTLFIIVLTASITLIFSDEAFIMRIDAIKDVLGKGVNPLGRGIGFVTSSGFADQQVVFDNDYLRIIYEIGIIGFLSYLVFIFSVIKKNPSKELIALIVYFFLLMYTGDIHSMYPIPVIIYTSIAVISRKNEILKTN